MDEQTRKYLYGSSGSLGGTGGQPLRDGAIPLKDPNDPNTVINSSLLEPVSQLPYVNPNPSQIPPIAGLSSDISAQLKPTSSETVATDLTTRLMELNNRLTGQSTYRTQLETDQNLAGLQKTQQDLSNQLKAVQSEAQAIPLQLQNDATGRGITEGGLAPLQTARLRTNAIQALGVSAALQASQGNLSLAMDQIDRAVAAKFDPIKEAIATQQANLQLVLNSPAYSLDEKRRAESMLAMKNAEAAKVATDAQNAKDVYDISLKAAQLGGDGLAIKAIQSTSNATQALQVATALGLVAAPAQREVITVQLQNGNTQLRDKFTGELISDLGGAAPKGADVLSTAELLAYGLPAGSTTADIVGKMPKNEIQKQNELDYQTAKAAYEGTVAILARYGLTPETATADAIKKVGIEDTDAQTLAINLGRVQKPDVARAGGDTGDVLSPDTYAGAIWQEIQKQNPFSSQFGKDYSYSKLSDAIKTTQTLVDQREKNLGITPVAGATAGTEVDSSDASGLPEGQTANNGSWIVKGGKWVSNK